METVDLNKTVDENDLLNSALIVINEYTDYRQDHNWFATKILDRHIQSSPYINHVSTQRALEKLASINFVDKFTSEGFGGAQVLRYSISSIGHSFVFSVPAEYKNKPYYYYLKEQEDKKIREEEKERLQKEQIQSVTDTNTSVRITNRIQIFSAITTIIIIGATLYVQFKAYEREKPDTKPMQDSLQQVKNQVDSLKTSLYNLNYRLDSAKKKP